MGNIKNRQNDLTNPVGSTSTGYTTGGYGSNPDYIDAINNQAAGVQDPTVDIYGMGGKVRHSGIFSDNNPYLEQMNSASRNQDIDALYELAVKWEADYANTLEERQYNSPEAQIARQRAAGINPDLAGASGSGSSGVSATGSAIPQQQGQTKFSNAYDNASLVMEGINTAANAVSAFTGGFSNIISAVDQLRTLPARLNLKNATANLYNAEANQTNRLLDGKKTSIDLANSMQTINAIESLVPLIQPESTDDDMTSLLASVGLGAEALPMLKQAQSNPAYLAGRKAAVLANREMDERLKVYTSQVFHELVDESLQLEQLGLDFDIMHQKLANTVQRFLSNDKDYAEDLADITRINTATAADQSELAADMFRRDLAGYQNSLDALVAGHQSLKDRNAELDKIRESRPLDPVEQLEYDTNLIRMDQMMSLGSAEVNHVYSILRDAQRQQFYLKSNTGYSEEKGLSPGLGTTGVSDKTIVYGNIAFGDVLNGVYTSQQLTQEWAKIIGSYASTGAQIYMGYRLGKVGNSARSVTNYKYNKGSGKYEITHGEVTLTGPDATAPVDIYQPQGARKRPGFNFSF